MDVGAEGDEEARMGSWDPPGGPPVQPCCAACLLSAFSCIGLDVSQDKLLSNK